MEISTPKSSPRVSPNMDARILHSGGRIEIVYLTLAPGEKVNEHTNPLDIIFFILEGRIMFFNDNESCEAEKNTSLFVRSGTSRSMENHTKHICRIMIIKIK